VPGKGNVFVQQSLQNGTSDFPNLSYGLLKHLTGWG